MQSQLVSGPERVYAAVRTGIVLRKTKSRMLDGRLALPVRSSSIRNLRRHPDEQDKHAVTSQMASSAASPGFYPSDPLGTAARRQRIS